ncbi:protein phosphatase 1 regulatory subunit 7-like [Argopecten irradians]
MEGLDALVNLQELYLSDNGIERIEGMEHNLQLNTLDLASNRIQKIENVSHLVELQEFWFNDNRMDDWKDLEELAPIKILETVYFERNPLWKDPENAGQADPNYRRKVKLALPQVRQIDATLCK